VARAWNTSVDDLLGRDRSQKIAEPRQVAMYLLRQETDASLPQIGEVLGGRDHTTVMYAIEKISDVIERDDRLRNRVKQIRDQLIRSCRMHAKDVSQSAPIPRLPPFSKTGK
jgi:chromosomal replication initiator protein